MDNAPQAASFPAAFRPENAITDIADFIADPVEAAAFPAHILRYRNVRAATSVGLDALTEEQWTAHFSHFVPLPGSLPQPLALRYHGHQFRHYNPDIGDGRGFLFAQVREEPASGGRLLDLGTKGSGQTPYSRFGDGRLTLKGAMREILATEMLEALGVLTSRTFSVIETGENLQRHDEPSPTRSAVLVRLSHGHIRIGSFQRLLAIDTPDDIDRLAEYCLHHLYGAEPGEDACATLYDLVVSRCADLAASYMVAGFVHGVLNSDNIAITGESFDYGPWRFAPRWKDDFTAAYFDHNGLYSFGRQAEAIHWNLAQLAQSLATEANKGAIIASYKDYAARYHERLNARTLWRLGVATSDAALANELTGAIVTALRQSDVTIDRFFFDWRGSRDPMPGDYAGAAWDAVRTLISRCDPVPGALDHEYWHGENPVSMLIDDVESLWADIAAADDWTALEQKVAAIRTMGAAHGPPPVATKS